MSLIRKVLRLNAITCLVFGGAFVAGPAIISAAIGNESPWLLRLLGVLLVIHCVHLMLASRRSSLVPAEVMYFSIADFLWVAMTLVCIASNRIVTTDLGVICAIVIAIVVGHFGLLQLIGMCRENLLPLLCDRLRRP